MKSITVAIHTLGCKVNQCETDALLTRLKETGYSVCDFHSKADIYIINTCTVTHTGDKKSLQMIRRARRQNPEAFVAVCGCMARSQVDSADKINIAGADFIFDTRKPEELLAKLKAIFPGQYFSHTPEITDNLKERTRAFIKIQDGCDRFCSYCIVPYVRGQLTSRSPTEILAEAQAIAKRGIQEIVLTGIQVAAYGYDTGNGYISLPGLIRSLAYIPKRLRLSSIEPMAVTEDFLLATEEIPTLCDHFHLSLQSGSDKILSRMNRRYTQADYAKVVNKLRSIRPTMALTTDIIVGFPGETEVDFQDTLKFIKEIGFAQIHIFEYSPRQGTPAADFPDQVPSQIKTSRGKEMRALATELQHQFLSAQIGTVASVLFETKNKNTSKETWQGHSTNYSTVQVQGTNLANTIHDVRITGTAENTLIGELVAT